MENATRTVLRDTLRTAAIAATTTGVTATVLGKLQTGSFAAPLNATSHIVWGDRAARRDRVDLAHTGVGAALNTWAMFMWSGVQHGLFGRRGRPSVPAAIASGVGISAFAYVLDYYVLPQRLTPGVEKRLSKGALLGVFAALAGGLAFGLATSARGAR